MKRQRIVRVAGLMLLLGAATGRAGYTNLHSFAGGAGDGDDPHGSLLLSGTTLYGMTRYGGASSNGVIFKANDDGSGYTNLHSFAGGAGDGRNPYGSLTLSGTTLYGMTYFGGVYNHGVVFRMNADGSGYTNLHEFAGGPGDGVYPYGELALSGTTLYGMTQYGGAHNIGVVFKVNTDGSGYTNLHSFAGNAGDGAQPLASLTLFGTTLYGMTYYGGVSNRGVVFRLHTDGSAYTNLHEFAGGAGDGAQPLGSLTLSGTTLYGLTVYGGPTNIGVVFKVNADGSGYTNLHAFTSGAGDGSMPYGSLTLSGTMLYGLTAYGGATNKGVVFQIHADGSGYTDLHAFTGSAGDGAIPYGSLAMSGTTLYGMTVYGGASNKGVVFALSQPVVTGAANPTNAGSVAGGGSYAVGTSVQLTAVASNGWLFASWNDGATNNPYTVSVPATNITYTATFTPTAAIAVQGNHAAGGTVSGGGTYVVGSNAVLSATTANGWQFLTWSDGVTNNPRAVLAASNTTYTALWTPQYTLRFARAQTLQMTGAGWGDAGLWSCAFGRWDASTSGYGAFSLSYPLQYNADNGSGFYGLVVNDRALGRFVEVLWLWDDNLGQ